MSGFDFSITPTPAAGFLDLPVVRVALRTVLALNEIAPLSKIVFTQTQESPENRHQFQVYFADARSWVDELEFPGSANTPDLTRLNAGARFSHAEWIAITKLRDELVAMHNGLGEPSLISVILASDSSSVVLNASPLSAVHTVGTLDAEWHSPLIGHLDWIGLFRVGDPNSGYLAYYTIPDGTVDGDHNFHTPGTPGSYEFRYLVANSFTSTATSPTMVVT